MEGSCRELPARSGSEEGECVWSDQGKAEGNPAASHNYWKSSYRVGSHQWQILNQEAVATQCSLQGSDQMLGSPLCPRSGAALGHFAQRDQGISFPGGF